MPREFTSRTTLEHLKREARRWLTALHGNDREARARLERADPDAPGAPTLRDVQRALAREYGFPGWKALRERLAARPPDEHAVPDAAPGALVLRFLDNACPDHHVRGLHDHIRAQATAMRLLDRHPGLAHANFQTAIVCGDLETTARLLAGDPELATRRDGTPMRERSGSGGRGDLVRCDLGPKGWEPLLYLCFTRLPLQAVTDNAVALATLLLEHGADPTAYFMAGDSRYTPLVGVIGEGEENRPAHQQRDALARLLLERGADPYDSQVMYNIGFHMDELWFLELSYQTARQRGRKADWDDPEWSMLDMGGYGSGARWHLEHAIRKGDAALVAWCLQHGANANAAPPRDGRFSRVSLYEMALRQGHPDIAELLARHGAVRSEVLYSPMEAFVSACLRGDHSEVRRLVAAHPEFLRAAEPLLAAARRDRADVVAFLLDLGMSPEVENAQKERALHVAAYGGAVDVVDVLLAHGAEVDPVESNWGNTPLGAAAYYQHRVVMDRLAARSRDVWELALGGYIDRLREVLDEKPERATATWSGDTPLMWLPPDDEALAVRIARLFLRHGADATLRNSDGMTAADIAERNGMFALAVLLREAAPPSTPNAGGSQRPPIPDR
jgi:ankyrin repeat protein